jgi:hypothetical protein
MRQVFASPDRHSTIGALPSHDLADADCFWRTRETDAAALAAHRLDHTGTPELMHHFHQVVSRDAVRLGDFRDRREPRAVQGEIHQYP